MHVPGDDSVDFHFNFGFGQRRRTHACRKPWPWPSKGRYESYSLGKDVSVHQVREISAITAKHGFRLAGYRSFEAWRPQRRSRASATASNALSGIVEVDCPRRSQTIGISTFRRFSTASRTVRAFDLLPTVPNPDQNPRTAHYRSNRISIFRAERAGLLFDWPNINNRADPAAVIIMKMNRRSQSTETVTQ